MFQKMLIHVEDEDQNDKKILTKTKDYYNCRNQKIIKPKKILILLFFYFIFSPHPITQPPTKMQDKFFFNCITDL